MGRSFRVKVIHMNTETTAIRLDDWEKVLIRKGLKRDTIRMKMFHIRRCMRFFEDRDLSTITAEDFTVLADGLGSITPNSKGRIMNSFNEYLAFVYGISPYNDLRTRCRVGSRDSLALILDVDPRLNGWLEWLVGHNRDRTSSASRRASARNGMIFLLERYPDLKPETVTEEMIMAIYRDYPGGRNNQMAVANDTAAFAEWCGAGPVQDLFHEMRNRTVWEDRVFSGRFGKELRSYHTFMVEHYYRPNTCVGNVNTVRNMLLIMEPILGEFRLEDLTEEDFMEVRYTQDRVSEPTLRAYMTVFGLFVEHVTGTNPYNDRLMRWSIELAGKRKFLTDEEWAELAREADPTERIIVVLGSMMGLRRMEIANLKVEDVGKFYVHVEGKGSGPRGKEAEQVLDDMTRALIGDYMAYRGRIIETYGDRSKGRLVICDRGDYVGCPYSAGGISRVMRRLSDRTGVYFTCHCLRRYYATSLYDDGTELNKIRVLMRHTSLETTLNKYINVDTRKLIEAQSGVTGRMAALAGFI